MGLWSVIVPVNAVLENLIANPSIELGTTGFSITNGSQARDSSASRRGVYSLKVAPNTGASVTTSYSITLTNAQAYTFSFDVLDVAGQTFNMQVYDSTSAQIASTSWTGDGQWKRKTLSFTANANQPFTVRLNRASVASTTVYYTDGWQLVAVNYEVSYIDGDMLDCYWTGGAHSSTSRRIANSTQGGQIVNLDTYGLVVQSWSGAGSPDTESYTEPFAVLPGSIDNGERVPERKWTIAGEIIATSLAGLHSYRKALMSVLRPGRTLWLTYQGANANRAMRIRGKFLQGLGFTKREGFSEKVALQFQSTDPFWYEDGQEGAVLTTVQSLGATPKAIKYVNGAWSIVHSQLTSLGPDKIVRGTDGALYMIGGFSNIGDASGDQIIKFANIESTTSISLGTGVDPVNGPVNSLAIAPNGDVYIGGNFTTAGGVANTNKIARWNGSTWNALSTGVNVNGTVFAIAFDFSGNVFLGGSFVNFVDANGDYITKWNGSAFASVGTGMNGLINDMITGPDGSIYATGEFTTGNGVTLNGIGKWNGTTWVALGTGLSGGGAKGYSLAIDPAGNVYVGGDFTSADGVSCANIAKWNGKTFEPLGTGLNNVCNQLRYSDDTGLLYVSGNFTTAGGLPGSYFVTWNGTTWTHASANIHAQAWAILTHQKDVVVGTISNSTYYTSYLNTVVNTGTSDAYPRIVITCTKTTADEAVVKYLENVTTGARIWLNYSLQNGETLTLDFTAANRSVESSYYKNVIGRAVLRNSDFVDFKLQPGSNGIGIFVDPTAGTPTITATISWPISHLAIDGSAA